MASIKYVFDITPADRMRVKIETKTGKVTAFVVQQESYIAGEWRAIVRYNYAHGKPHKDLIYPDGGTKKEWIDAPDMGEVIERGRKDIMSNWEKYRMRYEEGIK